MAFDKEKNWIPLVPIPAQFSRFALAERWAKCPTAPSRISCFFINRCCHSTTSELCFYPATELWKPLVSFSLSIKKMYTYLSKKFLGSMIFPLLFPQMFSSIPQCFRHRSACGPSGCGGWEGHDPSRDHAPISPRAAHSPWPIGLPWLLWGHL